MKTSVQSWELGFESSETYKKTTNYELFIPANIMSHLDSDVVIPACPESIFTEGLPTSGSDR